MASTKASSLVLHGRRRTCVRLRDGVVLLEADGVRRRIPVTAIERADVHGAKDRQLTVVLTGDEPVAYHLRCHSGPAVHEFAQAVRRALPVRDADEPRPNGTDLVTEKPLERAAPNRTANVLDSMAKSAQPAAKRAIQDIYNAEDKDRARKAVAAFARQYGAKYHKAVKKITDDEDELLAFFDFPAEHWIHLRTTNPIESTFATVRLRTKVTKGAGSRAAGMVFKLVESAQARWRSVNAPHLVALVRAGARFERGHLVERPETLAA